MTTPETSTDPAASTPVAAPDAAPTSNAQPIATDAPQAQPDAATAALNASQSNPLPASAIESAPHLRNPNWARRLRPPRPLIGIPKAEPRVGENDLLIECSFKLTSRTGAIIDFPLKTTLSGSLSPAFLPLVQQQFELVLNELLVKPVTIAFISHLEVLKNWRKAEVGKATQAAAAEAEREQEAAREMLNRKATV